MPMRRVFSGSLLLLLPLAGACTVPFVTHLPVQVHPPTVGRLVSEERPGISVVVHDARPDPAVLGALTNAMQPDRIHWLFAADKPGDVALLFQNASKDAAATLGFGAGTDLALDLTIAQFRIDMHSSGSISNCIGYGIIGAVLKAADGAVLRSATARVVYWEDTAAKNGFKDISMQAISRLYMLAAWQATAGILREQYPSIPANAVRGAIALTGKGTDLERREGVFWLGLIAGGDSPQNPSVETLLLALFRGQEDQTVAQAAAEAIGMIRLESAKPDLEAALSGSKKLPDWDIEDTESVWYLLKGLHGLGVTDLASRIPPGGGLNMRDRLVDLTRFLASGEIPPMSASRAQDYETGKQKLK